MDVNKHIQLAVFLAFVGTLAILMPESEVMAQTVTSAQNFAAVHPTVLQENDNGTGFTDSIWLILLALGGFLYLINHRSV